MTSPTPAVLILLALGSALAGLTAVTAGAADTATVIGPLTVDVPFAELVIATWTW